MDSDKSLNTTFEELIQSGALEIGDGYRAKNEELGGAGPIFLRAGHINDAFIDLSGAERFDEALTSRVASKMSRPGDTIITTKGNSIGRTSFVTDNLPPFVYSPHLCYWRSLNPKRLVPGFLRYWARSSEFHSQLRGMQASTDMAPYLSLTDQRRLRIRVPSLESQRTVAGVLGALDDQIDLNRRMNETLEATARALFKSWFVDLAAPRDTPNGLALPPTPGTTFESSTKRLPNSTSRELPPAWTMAPLMSVQAPGRYAFVAGPFGSNLTSRDYVPTGVPVIRGSNLGGGPFGFMDDEFVFVSEAKADALSGNLAYPGDVVFTQRGTLGQVSIIPSTARFKRYVLSQSQMKLECDRTKVSPEYVALYFSQPSVVEYIVGNGQQAGVPHVNLSFLRSFPILVPPVSISNQFSRLVDPLVARLRANLAQADTLSALRDTLLPRLLAGDLRPRDVGRDIHRVG